MKKVLMTACCSLALGGFLYAEDSGAFVGVSYQFSQAKFNQNGDSVTTAGATVVNKTSADYKHDHFMNGAGIKLGYKQFFGASKWFGLRYYGFLDYGYVDFGKGVLPKDSYHANMLSYGVGIDTLWDFVNKENTNLGIFVGVGVGADTWIPNGKDFQKEYFPNGKVTYANFQTTIDVGLRGNFHKHHGLEIGVKVPLLQDSIFKDVDDKIHPAPFVTTTGNLKTDLDRQYSIYASYIYTF
ncbi:outer membrane protein [Helicobacter sp. 13S00477-4]|uniref:outer membrane protein n=1 Tax=Helicobacter sp. 13S00477-4 TaxID=1905759 RepID=UPI000BA537A7|nr:outer membrane protein [Helicobacter sp. 13S00477-4]PAF52593.1 hypothetical protein BKH44_02120 [Helicobacter sp. 13S00477-4]